MRNLIRQLNIQPGYSKFYSWGKLITITGGAQIIVQATILSSGIAIIRLLSTREYALYTIANAMLGTMNILADGGIGMSVLAQGGQVWQDKEKLGSVLSTGLDLRRKLAIGSLVIAIPILCSLLIRNGATFTTTFLVAAGLIPTFYSALSDTMLETILKLNQDIPTLQKNQILVNIMRLIFSISIVIFLPLAFVALLINGLTRYYGNLKLYKKVEKYANYRQRPDPEVRKRMLGMVKRNMPELIYYSLSGQITIWLLSIFSSTTSVAQVGALGRFGMALNIILVLFTTLVIPRFSRLSSTRNLLKYFFIIFSGIVLISLVIILFVWLFSNQLLFILGKNYMNLQNELVLYIISCCISTIISVCFSLYASRGFIMNPVFAVASNLFFLVIGISLFNITTMHGVLLFNIFIAACLLLTNSGFAIMKLSSRS